MMITIQGLAPTTKYVDVKLLIKQECNIEDYILDNLKLDSDGSKKVRIGLANDSEGLKLMKRLNGYQMPGNYVIKVSPVGAAQSAPPGGYDSRPSYQKPPRNEYQNPPRSDYPNQPHSNDYNRGPHGSSHGPNGPNRALAPNKPYGPGGNQGPPDNRHGPWVPNNNTSSQWNSSHSMPNQVPQNSFNYGSAPQPNASSNYMPQHSVLPNPRPEMRPFDQGRPGVLAEQSYGGYGPKSNLIEGPRQPDLRQNLRSIEARDGSNQGPPSMSSQGGRYPGNQYQQDKPVTIMKDNFQGPTPFNINHPSGSQSQYPPRGSNAPWSGPPQQVNQKPQIKPYEERKYPPSDPSRDPKNLPPRPDTYKEYEKRRGYSPPRDPIRRSSPARRDDRDPGGRLSDMGPRRSPVRMEPQRRISPPGRRDDTQKRYSPGRRISPAGIDRRNIGSHPLRHESPHKRVSPNRRLVSPGRRDERQIPRYSPGRHHSDKMADKFRPDMKDLKKVRPAYEPTSSHAPNQAPSMYSGGFRSSNHDNVDYTNTGGRDQQSGSWQRHTEEPILKKHDLERRHMTRERVPEQIEKRFSPSRKSRSPIRRDRSPIRDRFKRNSPSPRSSYSPSRSWALEKRRSPDAPPPPVWPGQNTDREPGRQNRPSFPEKDEKPKHQPVWEGRSFKEEELCNRRPDEQRSYDEAKLRVAKELLERESSTRASASNRYPQKYSPHAEYEDRPDNYRRRDLPERKPFAPEFDSSRRAREDDRFDNYSRRRESPRRETKIEPPKDFDKDFEDIYNRAVEFKKKAEELRKSSSRKRDDFDDRRYDEKFDGKRRYEDHDRQRAEESFRQRERDDRPPRDDRRPDDRLVNDRARPRDDDPRDDYRPRVSDQNERNRQIDTTNTNRHKKEKAVEEISQKILERNEEYKHVQGEQRRYILEELKQIVNSLVDEMFGDSEVSFIEVIIKYQARYNLKDEVKIMQDAIRSLPKHLRPIKRHAPEPDDVPAKINRVSPSTHLNQQNPTVLEPAARPKLADSNINVKLPPPGVLNMGGPVVQHTHAVMGQSMTPAMVPSPFYQSYDSLQHNYQTPVYMPEPVQPVVDVPPPIATTLDFEPNMFTEDDKQEGFKLYLCRDDFERISHMEADLLKDYLITQMFQATGQYQGWSPDFTFKGLQGLFRYEVTTKDEWSKNWLLNLDFSKFEHFHILVYTREELWYERAAIWLPGHSRVRNLEPFEKLKLQNKKLGGVNIEKWKLVKTIVNEKGARLYVDMPPSSARALEAHEMKLSYELQEVNVFLKAVAVDKDSFDAGLKQISITDPSIIERAIKNSPMPVLTTNDASVVKITLRGSKKLDLVQARKIKEVVIYNMFQYHRLNGNASTDFIKYGFVQPNFFAILPKNHESKRWLMNCSLGKINRQDVVVVGAEDNDTKFIKMGVVVPYERQLRNLAEKLKQCNQGVKNINFNLWKTVRLESKSRDRIPYEVEVDMGSLETLASLGYQLDYVTSTGLHTVTFTINRTQTELQELIRNHKAEMMDSYDVANMDLDSNESECSDGVICLD